MSDDAMTREERMLSGIGQDGIDYNNDVMQGKFRLFVDAPDTTKEYGTHHRKVVAVLERKTGEVVEIQWENGILLDFFADNWRAISAIIFDILTTGRVTVSDGNKQGSLTWGESSVGKLASEAKGHINSLFLRGVKSHHNQETLRVLEEQLGDLRSRGNLSIDNRDRLEQASALLKEVETGERERYQDLRRDFAKEVENL